MSLLRVAPWIVDSVSLNNARLIFFHYKLFWPLILIIWFLCCYIQGPNFFNELYVVQNILYSRILCSWNYSISYQCCLHRRLCSVQSYNPSRKSVDVAINEFATELNGQYTVQKTQGLKHLLPLCTFLANFNNNSISKKNQPNTTSMLY
jgi:hypothetical protein